MFALYSYRPDRCSVINVPIRCGGRWIYARHPVMDAASGVASGRSGNGCAIGEFLERMHFRDDVAIHAAGRLLDINPPELGKKFLDALTQLSGVARRRVEQHCFELTRVFECAVGEWTFAPRALLSLGVSTDRAFVPISDSCGSACGRNRNMARANAMLEFIERQRLVASWLAQKAEVELIVDESEVSLGDGAGLLSMMRRSGVVRFIEPIGELPGYVVVAIYLSERRGSKASCVIAASASLTPASAIQKAVAELWQGFFWLSIFRHSTPQSGGELMMQRFLQNNVESGFRVFEPWFCGVTRERASEYVKRVPLEAGQIMEWIRGRSAMRLLRYEARDGGIHYAKFFGPDFFLHMQTDQGLNVKCGYASACGLTDLAKLNLQALPFP